MILQISNKLSSLEQITSRLIKQCITSHSPLHTGADPGGPGGQGQDPLPFSGTPKLDKKRETLRVYSQIYQFLVPRPAPSEILNPSCMFIDPKFLCY